MKKEEEISFDEAIKIKLPKGIGFWDVEFLPKRLTRFGLGTFRNDPPSPLNWDKVWELVDYLKYDMGFIPSSRYYRDRSSYGFKHDVEKLMDNYVANGDFIAAMIILGYQWKPTTKGSPNVFFKVSKLSPIINVRSVYSADSYNKGLYQYSLRREKY